MKVKISHGLKDIHLQSNSNISKQSYLSALLHNNQFDDERIGRKEQKHQTTG
jgi:hypothetical protein